MAYPTICKNCLEGDHDGCLQTGWDLPDDLPPEFLGGAFCVCGHGADENAFQQSVRANVEEAKKEKE